MTKGADRRDQFDSVSGTERRPMNPPIVIPGSVPGIQFDDLEQQEVLS